LLARALPLPTLPFYLQEEEKDLEKLLHDLSLELRPQGRIEEMLVERIGCIHFQLSRVYRFQTASTAVAMYKEFGAPTVRLGDPLTTTRLTEELPKNLTRVLERCKEECASDELFSAELMKEIRASILTPRSHQVLQGLYEEIVQVTANGAAEDRKEQVEKLKKNFVSFLAISALEILNTSQDTNDMIEELTKASFEQHLLPDEATLRKILRYESMLDRELHRSLDRLERLQARRAADPSHRSRLVEGSVRGNG
jgi:hypothetical protein